MYPPDSRLHSQQALLLCQMEQPGLKYCPEIQKEISIPDLSEEGICYSVSLLHGGRDKNAQNFIQSQR